MNVITAAQRMWEAFKETFRLSHSLQHEKYMLNIWAVDVTRHILTRDLDILIVPAGEELELAIERMDTENWLTVNLLKTMRLIFNRTGSRFSVGIPLCKFRPLGTRMLLI